MRILLSSLLAFVLFTGSMTAQTPTVDEILDGYFDNIGGKEAWRAVTSMKIMGEGVQMGMNFPLTVFSKAPNLTKVLVDVQGMQIIEAFDGKVAWATNPFAGSTEPTKKTDEETDEMAKQDFQDALLDYKDKGHTVTLEGKEEYEGTEVYKLKLVKKGGDEILYFFDAELWVPVAVRSFAKTGQLKGQSIDNITSDYQEVDGLMIPFSMKQKVNGQLMLEMVAKTVQINVPISDAEFAFPGK